MNWPMVKQATIFVTGTIGVWMLMGVCFFIFSWIDSCGDIRVFEACQKICGAEGVSSVSGSSCGCREKIKVIN